jgi:hypothetical protein
MQLFCNRASFFNGVLLKAVTKSIPLLVSQLLTLLALAAPPKPSQRLSLACQADALAE